jgi:hypothetical protein
MRGLIKGKFGNRREKSIRLKKDDNVYDNDNDIKKPNPDAESKTITTTITVSLRFADND